MGVNLQDAARHAWLKMGPLYKVITNSARNPITFCRPVIHLLICMVRSPQARFEIPIHILVPLASEEPALLEATALDACAKSLSLISIPMVPVNRMLRVNNRTVLTSVPSTPTLADITLMNPQAWPNLPGAPFI